ncbi:carbohydrate ABC transporter permease, partial [Isoptericola sp. NPDC056134]|uniref:carbohydrate ABC transporter permease n=1 Tax=Isoptericola sp. NPDC056134 TaxID=3345723 RepID=UPI0035E8DD8D
GVLWNWILNAQTGALNVILRGIGIENPPNWLGDTTTALSSVMLVLIWVQIGYPVVIFMSALQRVDPELYEAAELDGASQWQVVRAIKIPAIRGSLVIATIFSIIGSFQLFNEPSILQSLAPNAITTYFTPNLYAYSLSFSGQQYNYSATVAIIMGVLTMIVAYVVQLRGMRKEA